MLALAYPEMLPLHPDARKCWCREFFDELAAMVLQAPANLPVLYPVGPLEKVLYVGGVGPETVCEGLRLGVPNGIAPKFYGQFLNDSLFHENLSGSIAGCHPVNL